MDANLLPIVHRQMEAGPVLVCSHSVCCVGGTKGWGLPEVGPVGEGLREVGPAESEDFRDGPAEGRVLGGGAGSQAEPAEDRTCGDGDPGRHCLLAVASGIRPLNSRQF